MSFTFASLKQAIQDYTENSEASFITNLPLFIRQAEERILKGVQLNLFRKTQTTNVAQGNQYLEIPVDFLAPFSLSIVKQNPLPAATNPFPNGAIVNGVVDPTSSGYLISSAILEAALNRSPWNVQFLALAQPFASRFLGDLSGNGSVNAGDSALMTDYINYKYGSGDAPATDVISYVETGMLPYMSQSSTQSTYRQYYYPFADEIKYLYYKDVGFVREFSQDTSNAISWGEPRYYSQFDNDNFIVGPAPNSTYQVQLSYLYRPTSLTAGAEDGTTWLSINAEMCLLYGSLIEAYIYMKGSADVLGNYNSRFQEALVGVKMLGEAKQTIDEFWEGRVMRQRT